MPTDKVKIDILSDTKKASSGVKGLIGNLAKLGGVVAGLKGLQVVLNKSVDAYKNQIDSESKLLSILKSTGNQTGMTAKEIKNYAGELQDLTGVGDDAIINSQALLATFTKIGGDAFPRATELALDMSKAFGQDLKGSTLQLGKALQDPIQGVTALRRVGVQLSDQQTEMIKKFMDVGDVASAQNIILNELETQVGGVAKAFGETMPGQVEIYKQSIGDISEGLGEAVMTAMAPGIKKMNEFMKNNKTKIINIMKNIPEVAKDAMRLFADIIKKALSWDGFSQIIAQLGIGIVKTLRLAVEKFPRMFKSALDFLTAPVKNFGAWLGSVFKNIFGKVGNFFIDVLNKIPFVEIEKKAVEPVKSLGDAWNKTQEEMGIAFDNFVGDAKDYAVELADIGKDTGKSLGKIFDPEIQAFVDKLNVIMNKNDEFAKDVDDINVEMAESTQVLSEKTVASFKTMENGIKESMGRAAMHAQKEWYDKIEKIKGKYKEIEDVVGKLTSSISSIIAGGLKNQEIALENKHKKELDAITQSQASEESKQKAIEKLEKETDRKRAAIKRKQALADKAAAIAKIIMDTASAVVEALPNIPLSVGVGALGAVQLGVAAAQPIPSFATGGAFMTNGPQLMQVGDNASGKELVTVEPDPGPRKTILMIGEREFEGWLQDKIDNGLLRTQRAF